MPEPKDPRRDRWERSVAPLLVEADACEGTCRKTCGLWAQFVRGAGPEQVALARPGRR